MEGRVQSAIARRYLSGTDGLSFRTVVHSNKKVFLFDDLLLLVEQPDFFWKCTYKRGPYMLGYVQVHRYITVKV